MEKEKEKNQANDIIEELSEKAKENLRRNEELRRNWSPFFSIQPGEKLAQLFDAEKVKPVEREFDGKKVQQFEYIITDPNTGQEKYWTVGKRVSEQIDALLSDGHKLLKIHRLGAGKDTRYNIFPA